MKITNLEAIALNMLARNLYNQSNGSYPVSFCEVGDVWSNCLDSHSADDEIKGRTLSATCASLAKKGLVRTYNDTRTKRERRGEPNSSTIGLTAKGFKEWQKRFPNPETKKAKKQNDGGPVADEQERQEAEKFSEKKLADMLEEILEAQDEDQGSPLCGNVRLVESFRSAGILTNDVGVVVTLQDRSQFQITIVRSK